VSTLYLEDLEIGRTAERKNTVTDADIRAFAEVSGDRNPLHLDEEFALSTAFKGRIAHGMLSGAYISAALAGELPGAGSVYLSQTLNFKRPVRIGDEVTTRIVIKEIDTKRARITIATACYVRGKVATDGEATVMVPRRPTDAEAGGAA
jgi:3-hydroxybutyryl-CoA dehydratase